MMDERDSPLSSSMERNDTVVGLNSVIPRSLVMSMLSVEVSFYNDQLIVSARIGVFSMNPDTNEFRLLYDGYYYQTFTIDPKGFQIIVGQ